MLKFNSRKLLFYLALGLVSFSANAHSEHLNHKTANVWTVDSTVPATTAPEADNIAWWRTFGDPMLDSLISLAEQGNYNVAMAAKRIEISRAQVRSAQAAYYPQLGLNLGWTRERSSGRLAGSTGNAAVAQYSSGNVTMNWEIDVFGKITAQVKKGKAQVNVSRAEFGAVMVALEAEVATNYLQLLVYKKQLEVARSHSENQAQIVNITEIRHKTGLASRLDVEQARTLYYSTTAQIPLLESSIEASYNAIAVLLGLTRVELPENLYNERELPGHYQLVAMGAPLDILRRRPDIIEAENNIEVAAASLGIAKRDYLPSLSIEASVGTQAHRFGDLFTGPSFTYTVAPTLSWTIFSGFGRNAAMAEAKQNLELQIDNYNLTVLTAVEEVRNALCKYTATLKYIDAIKEVVHSSQESVNLSLDLYKQGLSNFTNVVDAQLNLLSYQNTLISARGDALTALVDLYKALGGGWYD